jgi:hypothetical protein
MVFPPVDHEWNLQDLVGATDLVEKLSEIEDAIRQRPNMTEYVSRTELGGILDLISTEFTLLRQAIEAM